MASTLPALPPELWGSICNHCSPAGLLNLACCSKQCYEIVHPYIWRATTIEWKSLESRSVVTRKTKHLHDTSHISFVCTQPCDKNSQLSVRSNLKYLFQNCNMKLISSVSVSFRQVLEAQYGYSIDSWICGCLRFCDRLTKLSFREASFSDVRQLSRLKNVEELEIVNCYRLSVEGMQHLLQLPKLVKLTLSHDDDMDGYADVICQMVNLRELRLPGCFTLLSSDLDRIVCSLTNLEVLNVYDCYMTEATYCSVSTSLDKLRVLDIGALQFDLLTSSMFQHLSTLSSLRSLTIEGSILLPSLKVLLPPSLEKLNICHCPGVSNEHISALVDHPSLRELTLGHSDGVTDHVFESISKSSSLRILNVFECPNISPAGLEQLPAHITVHHVDRCTENLYDLAGT